MRLAILLACLACPAMAEPVAEIVILGEVHDNPDAHLGQAAALRDLSPSAVIFEMLTEGDAKRADADRSLIEDAWAASGWKHFPIYAPIFDALGAAHIVGAAASRKVVRAVYSDGPAALFGPDAPLYGLDAALPGDEQRLREDLQFEAHCKAMPRDAMAGMVAVQRYRDAVFARAALEALERHGPPVALIVGNGHARLDWGVPAMIARAAPDITTYATGFVEGTTDMPFEEIRFVPQADRTDPCKSLNPD
ncbi:ChaN family lipoprotein [Roseovarius aquimarinus]|uniref:ChaN family lipoprotein n=1 Tax=Roseovarius aquimarinus TaxID=1229156 RepID=A0ABW7IAU8_9RHOB